MNSLNFSLENLSFLSLFIATVSYWFNLTKEYKKNEKNQVGNITTIIANICLGLLLLNRWVEYQYFPLSNLYESLIFLTWGLTLTTSIMEKKLKTRLLGATLSPLSLAAIAFANLSLPHEMQQATSLVPALKSNWLMMHVSVMMISYVLLVVGCVLSLLYILVSNKTKRIESDIANPKKETRLQLSYKTAEDWENTYNQTENFQQPTLVLNSENENKTLRVKLLNLLDNASYRMIGLGFPFLTLGLISGAVWANDAWGSFWSWDPKETWALITWLVFATYLHTRINKQWKGRQSAALASFGFIVVWICYLGVNFLGKGLHSYGWLS